MGSVVSISQSFILFGICASWDVAYALHHMYHPFVGHFRSIASSSSSSSSRLPTFLPLSPEDTQWLDNERDYTSNVPSMKTRMNFKSLIEACKKTNVYTPAVTAAIEWLNNEPRLSPTGLTSVIQIFGLASLVDDAINAWF